MNLKRIGTPLCIVFLAYDFNFIIQLLSNFHGLNSKNPYFYLREFEEVYKTYNDLNCTSNTIRLRFFLFF